ncbi:MAG: hypothetical protein KAR18_07390, partial [Spirochaetes bacterium]|nr:hypothetical protein [Spirochaetota bacterium]
MTLTDFDVQALIAAARTRDDPFGFSCFYELVHGNLLPEHSNEEIEQLDEAHDKGMGSLTFAWRGSWKSTVISETFQAFRVGKEPDKSFLTVSSNDDSAEQVTASIARIIEYHEAWQMVFPHVVPDKERGWGAQGYNVMDNRMSYEDWEKKNVARIDDSFLGLGYNSRRLIGKHPTGGLFIDDIHDENNSISDRERQRVVNIVSDTLIPMEVKELGTRKLLTWLIAVGTPWNEDDSYHYLKNTGEYLFKEIPLMVKAFEGDEGAVFIDGKHPEGFVYHDIIGWWHITWPEQYSPEDIIRLRAKCTKRGFARMYLLDLEAAKEGGMPFQLYPSDAISYNWVACGGVDYASIRYRLSKNNKNRDLFAIAYLLKVPTGGGVIVGGVAGHKTQTEANDQIEIAQKTFKNWRYAVVEEDGKGETFVDSLLLKPHLRIKPDKTRGVPKPLRQEKVLGPALETGLVRVSDADTPFLNLLRKSLDDYPDGNDDVRDAAYWAVKGFPELLITPSADMDEGQLGQKKKASNPIYA